MWDLRHDVPIAEWSFDDGNIRVAISADGRSIAAVSETGAIGLWTAEGERHHDDRADGCVWGVALSVGAESGRIAVLDAATRRVLHEHQARCGVWTLALAPDGETLAVAGGHGVELMPATGAAIELPGPTNGVGCVAWLPDGRLLAGACDRGGVGWVYLWAEPLLPLRG